VVAGRGGRRPAGREDDPRSGTIGMVVHVVTARWLRLACYPSHVIQLCSGQRSYELAGHGARDLWINFLYSTANCSILPILIVRHQLARICFCSCC
jgi:hypothetical protein